MSLFVGFAAFGFVLALSGCGKVPVATQWKLRSYKIETADLRLLRVAVRAPDWIAPTADSGKLIVSLTPDGDESSKRVVTLRLRRANYPEDRGPLAELAGPEPLAIYEIDRRDIAVAAAAQEEARRLKQERPGLNHAEATIDRAGCRKSEIPQGPIPFDLYVHTDDATGWLTVLQAYDVRPDEAHEKQFLEKFVDHVPPCGKLADRVE